MASNYTEHYRLCQWDAADQVLREEFNQDNTKVDAALSNLDEKKAEQSAMQQLGQRLEQLEGMPQLVIGSYTGNNKESRLISLGFTPKAVLVFVSRGYSADPYTDYYYGGLALPEKPVTVQGKYSQKTVLSIEEQGFRVYYDRSDTIFSNISETEFYYLAWK